MELKTSSQPIQHAQKKPKPLTKLAQALADSLHAFSLDVVGVVLSYCASGTASKFSHPRLLMKIKPEPTSPKDIFSVHMSAVTCAPNGTVWIGLEAGARVFSGDDGKFLFKAPKDGGLGRVAGIAFSEDGCAFLADQSNNRIVVCDPDGALVREFGGKNEQKGLLSPVMVQPGGLVFVGNELAIRDAHNFVHLSTKEGVRRGTFGDRLYRDMWYKGPFGIARSSAGDIALSDPVSHSVSVFGSDGKPKRTIGSFGAAKGEFNRPTGLAFDSRDQLLVADGKNSRIQIFDSNGFVITMFRTRTETRWGGECEGVCVDWEGRIFVVGTATECLVFGFDLD